MNWGYIAGFLDADGSITSQEAHYSTRVHFFQCLKASKVLHEILKFLRTHGIKTSQVRKMSEEANPECHLYVSDATSTLKLLRKVLPHLIVKRDRAKLVLPLVKKRAARVAKTRAKYPKIIKEYAAGTSMIRLSRKYGLARETMVKLIKDSGIPIRDIATARTTATFTKSSIQRMKAGGRRGAEISKNKQYIEKSVVSKMALEYAEGASLSTLSRNHSHARASIKRALVKTGVNMRTHKESINLSRPRTCASNEDSLKKLNGR